MRTQLQGALAVLGEPDEPALFGRPESFLRCNHHQPSIGIQFARIARRPAMELAVRDFLRTGFSPAAREALLTQPSLHADLGCCVGRTSALDAAAALRIAAGFQCESA